MMSEETGGWGGGFATAYRNGAQAHRDGKRERTNPYWDLRTDRGSVTFSRAWQHAWRDGWRSAAPTPEGGDE